jgi:hypothetical protein
MMKIANKNIRTEAKLIQVKNGPSQPAATPRALKASVSLLIKQKQRVLPEDTIPENREMVMLLGEMLVALERCPTRYNARVAAAAAKRVDDLLSQELAWRLRNESPELVAGRGIIG